MSGDPDSDDAAEGVGGSEGGNERVTQAEGPAAALSSPGAAAAPPEDEKDERGGDGRGGRAPNAPPPPAQGNETVGDPLGVPAPLQLILLPAPSLSVPPRRVGLLDASRTSRRRCTTT